MAELITYPLQEIQHYKVHGRVAHSPLTLFWTASGIEINVKASELWIQLNGDFSAYEPWISYEINGAFIGRQMVQKGIQDICLFCGMNPEVVKNVRLYKDVQAMSGDDAHLLQIVSLSTDGTFLPVEDRPLRLEFIGDSITSGEGAIGAKQEEDWISMFFSAVHHYGKLTADALNADYRVISQSGWGVLTSWDNNPNCALPKYYEKVCGLAFGERNRELGAQEEYDFSKWQPDALIINLGTNDTGAFHSPSWTDPDTGEVYQQHLQEDGSFAPEDIQRTMDAIVAALKKFRHYNPKARLVWAYGMLGQELEPWLRQAIEVYQQETGDSQVWLVMLPDTTEESVGSRSHPGRLAHEKAAKVLTAALKDILK